MEADPWKVLKDHKYPLIIIGVGLVVYFNMLFNGFVWDDVGYITAYQQIGPLPYIFNNVFNSLGYFRPIFVDYLAFIYLFFQQQSFFYHFFQLVVHIMNTFFVLLLFNKLLRNRQLSFFLSLVFLVHPIQTESVVYVAASQEVLYFFFGMCGLLILMSKSLTKKRILLSLLFFLCSLLSKESGVLFIGIATVYLLLVSKDRHKIATVSSIWIPVIVYAIMRFFSGTFVSHASSLIPIAAAPIITRIQTIPAIVTYYLLTFFYPARLAIDQQWIVSKISFSSFYLPLIIILLIILIVVILWGKIYRERRVFFPQFLFFILWLAFGIGLHSQIIPLLDQTVADRWFYFPMVGLLGMLGIVVELFVQKVHSLKKTFFILISVVVLCLLSVRSIVRNANWYDNATLYQHDVTLTESFHLDNNLSALYGTNGDYKNAIRYAKKSVVLFPFEANLTNLGLAYEQSGDIQHAQEVFYRLQTLSFREQNQGKRYALNTYITLAQFLALHDNSKKVITLTKEGVKEYPNSNGLWFYLAIGYYKIGESQKAKNAIKTAYDILPDVQTTNLYKQIYSNSPLSLSK